MRIALSYVLPIRARGPVPRELHRYLEGLSALVEVLVVDGSADRIYEDFARRCGPRIRHVRPDEAYRRFTNGKVAGVLTGIRLSSHDAVVLADDDVRYDAQGLEAVRCALEWADLVRPQNYFAPLPWHAYVDTARTLINRMTGGDWPGTLGVRRSTLLDAGGYDGNVMFENLELVRTIAAAGGREHRPLDLFVRRLAPEAHQFWTQRVRQAYDELARPVRLAVWLGVGPALLLVARRYGPKGLIAAAAGVVLLAESGRQVGQGTRVFPAAASLAAPVWVVERAVCAWLAVLSRVVLGGVPYRGQIVRRAATPRGELVRRVVAARRLRKTRAAAASPKSESASNATEPWPAAKVAILDR